MGDPSAGAAAQEGCPRPRSNWWYVVALPGGLMAGLIIYYALRYDDMRRAKRCLLLGFVTLAPYVGAVVYALLAGMTDSSVSA